LSGIILLLILAYLIYVSVLFAGANQPRVRQVVLVLLISACGMPEATAVPIPVEVTFADLLAEITEGVRLEPPVHNWDRYGEAVISALHLSSYVRSRS
jgi:hypothetical protein